MDTASRKASVSAHEKELLRKCKLDRSKKRKLFAVLDKLRSHSDTPDDLIRKFGQKCYKHAPTEEDMFKQALTFCETAFGDKKTLFKKGPKAAFKLVLGDFITNSDKKSKHEWEFEFGKYWIGHVLGVGGQAEVRLALNTETEDIVAVKVFKEKFAVDAATEGNILKNLDNRNIIKVYDLYKNCEWQSKITTVMVMELANRGELIEYLMYTEKFEPPLVRWLFKSICAAVGHCHKLNIVHRDMKPDNCLFKMEREKFVVKINDFGFSKALDPKKLTMKTMVGTPQYAAPELLSGKAYTKKVDIFAMGVMLFVALSGTQPFNQADNHDYWYKKIIKGNWKKFWSAHEQAQKKAPKGYLFPNNKERDLFQGMVAPNPKERFSLEEVTAHDWIKEESYDDKTAKKKLEKRFETMDKHHKKSQVGGGVDRAIPWKEGEKPAPEYHTDFPNPGSLWFYSEDSPSGIIMYLNNVIKAVLRGDTDCLATITDDEMKKIEEAEKKKAKAEGRELPEPVDLASALSSGPLGDVSGSLALSSSPEDVTKAISSLDEEEKEDVVAVTSSESVPPTPSVLKLRRLAGVEDLSKLTCEEKMKKGVYEMNFTVKANKTIQKGRVMVFSCPSSWSASKEAPPKGEKDLGYYKYHIVKFISTKVDYTEKSTSSTQLLTKIYKAIIMNGGVKLMRDTRRTKKELKVFADLKTPQLDEFMLKELDITQDI